MTNILDKIKAVLGTSDTYCGVLPDKPAKVISLFEYPATPPEHSFGGTDIIHDVQARTRATTAAAAYALAETVVNRLNRYHDAEISVLQSTPILDIGKDSSNPQRQEYTVNFIVRRH